jgi:hypothetical protein
MSHYEMACQNITIDCPLDSNYLKFTATKDLKGHATRNTIIKHSGNTGLKRSFTTN